MTGAWTARVRRNSKFAPTGTDLFKPGPLFCVYFSGALQSSMGEPLALAYSGIYIYIIYQDLPTGGFWPPLNL